MYLCKLRLGQTSIFPSDQSDSSLSGLFLRSAICEKVNGHPYTHVNHCIPLESYIYDLLLHDIYETIPIRDVYEKCL